MSAEDTRKVVSRAVLDEEYRKTLYSDPAQALQGYDLTPDEVNALRAIPAETIDDFANNLEERISLSFVSFGAAVTGVDAEGQVMFGQAATGVDATGAEMQGIEAFGGETGGAPALTWFQRLAAVLGIGKGGGGSGGYY